MLQGVKKYFILLSLLPLGACGTTASTTAVSLVEKPTLVLPNVDNVRLNDVNWIIVNKNAAPGSDAHIDTAFKKGNTESLFAINPRDYEDLAINQANLVKAIRQYQAQVKAYKKYYETQQKQDNKNGNDTAQ